MNIFRKIEEILFYFLLFAIPFQARKILWQQNWYFNEWQAISLYLTDLILLVLFVFWVLFNFRGRQIFNFQFSIFNKFPNFPISKFFQSDFFLTSFLIVAAISIKNSSNAVISLFQFVKLAEFIAFYFYLKHYAFFRFSFVKALLAVFIGGAVQAVIAIGQFIKQSDLGLRWLGESALSSNLSGVASFFNSAGEKIIRAYGATPHPNILAAYLFLAIFIFYFLRLYKPQALRNLSGVGLMIFYSVLLLGLFFSFSRTIIFLWAAGFAARAALIWFKKDFRTEFWRDSAVRRRLILILIATIITMGIFAVVWWPEVSSRLKLSSSDEAVRLRIFYGKEALKSGSNWFGVGIGNFVNRLSALEPNLSRQLYQPVHNIYLLIYSETGMLGLASFVLFLIFLIKDFLNRTKMKELYNYSFLLIFVSILIIGFFDHFLFTIQQGRFIFWLGAALLTSNFQEILYYRKNA